MAGTTTGSVTSAHDPPEGFRIYGTFGLTMAGVARFLPTDGNTFKESLSGDRDDFYAVGSGGIAFGYRNLTLLFIYNRMIGETQKPGYTGDDYGSLSLTWLF